MNSSAVQSPVQEFSAFTAGVVPDEVISSTTPLVLRGFVGSWPIVASAKQSDNHLKAYLDVFDAELPVTVYTSSHNNERIGYKSDYSGFNFERNQSTLRAVVNELLESDDDTRTRYVGSTLVDRWLPGFRNDNDVFFNGIKPLVNFWLGNQTKISAHYDCPANIACCVAGRRTFTLFPPEQVSNLYVGPVDINPSGRSISLVDVDNPDHHKFPRFKEALASAQSVELAPGDALFVPPLWWHHVKSHDRLNMLVNYWWKDAPDYMGNPDLVLEHAILAIRGLSPTQKQAWKALFDHYVFADPGSAMEHIPQHIRGILNSQDENAVRRGWLNFSKKLKS